MTILSAAIRHSFLFGLLLLANRSMLAASNFTGTTVVSIEYEPADQALDPHDLANMQLVHTGAPLDSTQVAGTLDRMFASGLYDDIQVDAEPSGDGVERREAAASSQPSSVAPSGPHWREHIASVLLPPLPRAYPVRRCVHKYRSWCGV